MRGIPDPVIESTVLRGTRNCRLRLAKPSANDKLFIYVYQLFLRNDLIFIESREACHMSAVYKVDVTTCSILCCSCWHALVYRLLHEQQLIYHMYPLSNLSLSNLMLSGQQCVSQPLKL